MCWWWTSRRASRENDHLRIRRRREALPRILTAEADFCNIAMTSYVETDDAASTPSRSTRRRAIDAAETGAEEATPTSRNQKDF